MPTRPLHPAIAALLILTSACGRDEPTSSAGDPATFDVLSSPSGDSVYSAPRVPLVLRLTRGGAPLRNVEVRFASPEERDVTGERTITLGESPIADPWQWAYTARTDADGRVAVYLRFGRRAGTWMVHVRAPALSVAKDVAVTLRPWLESRIEFATSKDTAVRAGLTVLMSIRAVDHFGNTAASPLTVRSDRPGIVEWVGDGSIRTLATGRAFLMASTSRLRDSAGVSVVPPGRLLAVDPGGQVGSHARFVVFDTDGGNRREVTSPGWYGSAPYFLPGGVIVHEDVADARSGEIATIRLADTTGGGRLLVAPSDSVGRSYGPQPTRDGAWIYFSTLHGGAGTVETSELWRVRPDGTGLARVRAAGPMWTQYGTPSPSPAGDRLAVPRAHSDGTGRTTLEILDLASGGMRTIFQGLTQPRWSPVAEEIAVYARGVSVVRTDGSVAMVTPQYGERGWVPVDPWNGRLDWSPDGQWVLACAGSGPGSHHLALVSRATGDVLPLPFTKREAFCQAAWRP